ncbi:hypothetical protein RE075_002188 [Klebsiella aerogenes]|nr:hypothetical protein [Klebsiella aerogenes]
MTDITEQALVIPQREKHDWIQAVMRYCDFCQQWALTVRHSDGGCICASCCDAEYTSKLEVANAALVEALEKAQQHEVHASEMAVQLSKRLTAAENRISELGNYAEAEAVGADKAAEDCVYWMNRCKELESRTVTVKLPQAVSAGGQGYQEQVERILTAAGIKWEAE